MPPIDPQYIIILIITIILVIIIYLLKNKLNLNDSSTKYIFLVDKKKSNQENFVVLDDYKHFLYLLGRAYEEKQKLKIIIETIGGAIASSDIISKSLLNYPYGTEIFVANHAFSAGTFIVLSCETIYMNKWAVLTCVDPQIEVSNKSDDNHYSSKVITEVLKIKSDLSYNFLASCVESNIYHKDSLRNIENICKKKNLSRYNTNLVKNNLASGNFPHSKPYNYVDLEKMGIKIETEIPEEYKILYSNNLF